MMGSSLLAADFPGTWMTPYVVSILLGLCALYLYNIARAYELEHDRPPFWRWAWLLPLAFGFIYGLSLIYNMLDPIYRSFVVERGKKWSLGPYVSTLAPFIFAGAILLWDRSTKRKLAADFSRD